MTRPGPGRSERLFRTLLRAFPRSFREEYGTDAVELFRDRLAEARAGGAWAVMGLWMRTVPLTLGHGFLERVYDVPRLVGTVAALTRHASRALRRTPGVSAVVVLTLAVGIGANVALFAVLRGVLLRPLPYPEPERLVQLWETNPEVDDALHGPSPLNLVDWAAGSSSIESLAGWYLTSGTYRTDLWVEEIRSAQVTVDFFRTLGVEPLIGRDFRTEEVVRYGPVMLSYPVWQRLFGGDPAVVGRTIVASGSTYEIVGVMPRGFAYPDDTVETWVAWDLPAVYGDRPETRTWRFLGAVARLAEGQTTESAQAELEAVAATLEERHPEQNRGWGAGVTSLHEDLVGEVRGSLWLAFAAVGFILLIACANVANLLLARVPARSADFAVRSIMGGSRGRLAAELLTENLVLGVSAAGLGLLVGTALLEGLLVLEPGTIPRLDEVRLDPWVFVFTASVAVLTPLVFGLAPLLQLLSASRVAELQGIRIAGGRRQRSVREAFSAAQTALALVLLTGAGLFVTSLSRLTAVDPGIDVANVATFRVSLDPRDGTSEEIVRYYDGLLAALRAVPGVLDAGAAQTLPLNPVGNDFRRPYRPLGSGLESGEAPAAQMRIVTPRYVDAMGMTLLSGRGFPDGLREDGPFVALVNETLARRLWPDGDAVGRAFEVDFRGGWEPYTVLGVVRDVKHYGLRDEAAPEVFLPHAQSPYLAMSIVAKTSGDPAMLFDELRSTVLAHPPTQPAHNFVSMEELLGRSIGEERFLSTLLTILAAIGIVLACTGVYGVISYSVTHRRREIGVRMAIGAEPRRLAGSVFVRAMGVAGAGVLVGLVVALGLGRVVDGLLFGVTSNDPLITAGVAAVLLTLSAMAAYLPASRAARIPPTEALRSE